jgi:hypothetical protein
MVLGKYHFYLLRFRNASLPELLYRAKHFFLIKKLKIQLSQKKIPTAVPKIDLKNVKDLELPVIRGEESEKKVQQILKGKLFTLNADLTAVRKFEETWQHTYFDDIKLSDAGPDIRSVWEPARLQHLAILIHHIRQNEDLGASNRLKQFAKNALIKWINENPFPLGVHYISAMECGLRIPLFFYCLKVLDNLEAGDFKLTLDTLYRHTWWVSNRLSLYSSRGNHTIAEATGLVFGGAVYRNTAEGRRWLAKGHELLKRELDHQILKDGGPAEQSLNYHRFILDLYWLAVDFLEKNRLHDCSDFCERLIKAEQFIAAFEAGCGHLPAIGDSDDGCAIAPGIYPRRNPPNHKDNKIETFTQSGYTIIKDEDIVLTFDHGPLGMAPLYNHGHADALSVTLCLDNKKMLIDPGTYRYNGKPEFRKYYKGTRAHNTVTIDGLDQAVQETGFIWSRPFKAKLVKTVEQESGFFLQASHNGYLRLKKPVRHFRSIILPNETYFFIKDTFWGRGIHTFELNYHAHPDAEITPEADAWWKIDNRGAIIYIRTLNDVNLNVTKGQRNPPIGWYSPFYGIKCESGVLSCSIKGIAQEVSFITAICIHSPQEIETLSQRLSKIEAKIKNP